MLGVDFPVLELLTSKDEKLALSFIQGFVLEQTPDGDWKVRTTSYLYGIEDTAGNEILAFHWHPNSDASPVPYPHLHIGYGAGRDLRDEVASIHFRTDRMGFEDLGLMLLQDFRVLPERDDAVAVLTRNLEIFRRYRSWASVTE